MSFTCGLRYGVFRTISTRAFLLQEAVSSTSRVAPGHRSQLERWPPRPVRSEFFGKPLSTQELEAMDIGLKEHRQPQDWSDRFALGLVKAMRVPADAFFAQRYLNRAVVLETVAAVPGMVGGLLRHLRSLRRMKHDGGWITHLLTEAENERMHLLTWMRICQPNVFERSLVGLAQGVFFNLFFMVYLITPRTAHRVVGYLEEEALISYTHFLEAIDQGHIANVPAPNIAIDYWNLPKTARLRDVVLAVRADEAKHRDVNHHLSDRLRVHKEDLSVPLTDTEHGTVVQIKDDI